MEEKERFGDEERGSQFLVFTFFFFFFLSRLPDCCSLCTITSSLFRTFKSGEPSSERRVHGFAFANSLLPLSPSFRLSTYSRDGLRLHTQR